MRMSHRFADAERLSAQDRGASTERQVSGMILPLCFSDPRSSPRPRKSDRLPPFAGPVFPRRSVPLSAWALFA